MTAKERARRVVEEWRIDASERDWHLSSLDAEDDLVARLAPIFERVQKLDEKGLVLLTKEAHDTLCERAENAEKAQAALTAALAGEDNQAQRAMRAEAQVAQLVERVAIIDGDNADKSDDVVRLEEQVVRLRAALQDAYEAQTDKEAHLIIGRALAATEPTT
jgi:hypothetical protein